MHTEFPLFRSHLDLAHSYWARVLHPGDHAVDATCGNGHDTLALAQLIARDPSGKLYAYDVQEQAIQATRDRLSAELSAAQLTQIQLIHGCHSNFSDVVAPRSVRLVVYNLGYLPGSDKTCKTAESTTLESVESALSLLTDGGIISITCYPGHAEGLEEEQALLNWVKTLAPREWNCCHHCWANREKAPSLLLIQRRQKEGL